MGSEMCIRDRPSVITKRKETRKLREKTYKTEISRKQRKQIEEEGPIPSAHLTLSITFHTQYSKTITLERGDAALVFHPSHPNRETAHDTYFPALAYRKPGFVAQ